MNWQMLTNWEQRARARRSAELFADGLREAVASEARPIIVAERVPMTDAQRESLVTGVTCLPGPGEETNHE